MSIRIKSTDCVGCARCVEVCPGNLIKLDAQGKAQIRHVRDCWGCTSCVKECKVGAIQFFLGADIGGKGSVLTVKQQGDISLWQIESPDGQLQTIETNHKEANKY